MKRRLLEYLSASFEHVQVDHRCRWQRTRRRGRRRYVILHVAFFWLMMVVYVPLARGSFQASFDASKIFPHRTWGELLGVIIFGTVSVYLFGAYQWWFNERRYGDQNPP